MQPQTLNILQTLYINNGQTLQHLIHLPFNGVTFPDKEMQSKRLRHQVAERDEDGTMKYGMA